MLDTLKNERRQLEAEYLRATGQTDKYREALRKLATEGMTEAERAAWDYNQALREEIARLDQRTDLERKLLELQGNTAELRRRELAALDPSNRALQERIWAIEDEKAAQAAAYDLFRRAVDRDREALQQRVSVVQETINAIASSVGVLKSAAEELYGTVDSTAQLAAARGMVYIEQALDGVRSGRKLSEYTDIGGAVQATRAGLASGVYATDFERRRDALVWAGKFSELGALGESQLSIEERSLKVLQFQLEQLDTLAKRADELVNGTQTLTATVESYFAKLLGEDKAGTGTGSGKGGNKGGLGSDVTPGPGSNLHGDSGDSPYKHVYTNPDGSAYYASVTAKDRVDRLNALKDGYHAFDGTGDGSGLYEWARQNNATPQDLAELSGLRQSDWEAWMANQRMPAFAEGGLHSGGWRLVGERGWEVEATGPARYWNQEQLSRAMRGSQDDIETDDGLAEEVEALHEEVRGLRSVAEAIARNTSGMALMAEQFDRVTGGGNMMRSKGVAA